MAKGWRIFLAFTSFLIIIVLAIIALSYRLLNKSLPKTNGSLSLSILSKPAEVYRDEYGVPHVFADNEKDLFKVAGFVTAQDRLWQMDFNRRIANGELSEVLGPSAIDYDKHVRMWGFARTAANIADTLSPQSRTALEAYAAGVNAFIDSHIDRLPVEFSLLDYKPRRWRIEDSIAFVRLMGWKLSFSWYTDLVLQELVTKLGEKKAREVFPDFPMAGPLIVPSTAAPFWTDFQNFMREGLAVQDLLAIQGGRLGSNSWVVSGQKAKGGNPLLANDPHLELSAPSVWYEMHLVASGINVAGVSFPGVPGIVIGHNDRIAWGLTNGMIDDVDFYYETTNPKNAEQYWDGSKWAEFKRVTEEIKVKDAVPETLLIKTSRNGPIISQFHPVLESGDKVVSMRWVGHQASDEVLAYLKLQKARTWDEFTAALGHYKVPAQNFVFASSDGDIGYYMAGAVPIRYRANGVLPHNGRRKRGQWIDQVPFDKLPHILNPPEGYVVTANNKIVDDRYPYYLTNLWEPQSRAARIHQRLSEKELLSLDDLKDIQADLVSGYAQDVLPTVLGALRTALDSTSSDDAIALYHLIDDWDGLESPGSIAASIFNAFVLKFAENTLKDEMGENLYSSYIHLANVPNRVMAALLKQGQSSWFDNINTPEIESLPDIVEKSLEDAGAMLRGIAGDNIRNWAWGEIHTLTMAHPLARRSPLDIIFDIGPFPRGGSMMTINNSQYRFTKPFDAVLGSSTRRLVDLGDLRQSLSVITTGQSGQRMSEHYKDQTQLWLDGKYKRLVLDKDEIIATAREHLTLTPITE